MCGRWGGNPILKFLGSGGLCLIKVENVGVKVVTKGKSGDVLFFAFRFDHSITNIVYWQKMFYRSTGENFCPSFPNTFVVSELERFLTVTF